MSVYLEKGRGWRYDFVLNKRRYNAAYFKTKAGAKRAEARRREELKNPPGAREDESPTDTAFLELLNRRLDHVQAYNSARHYEEYGYIAKRWMQRWDGLNCSQITQAMIEDFILERSKVSAFTANKEIRYLKATFNFGIKRGLIDYNPVMGLDFLPVDKKRKRVPPADEIDRVIAVANLDTQDYLWTIRDTMGRVSEINALTWDDIELEGNTVTLYTRKKRGGHRTPREVPMTKRLHEILSRRHQERQKSKPWVFWSRHWDRKGRCWKEGPYGSRHGLLRKLCDRAGVKRFGFHALRHAGASILDQERVPLGTIQKILGHENRITTEIYLHSMGESEKAAIIAFERASGQSGKKSHAKSHAKRVERPKLKLVKG